MTERQYTPLPQANDEKVRINLSLPEFVDTNRVGVNLQEIHYLCRIAGIKHLLVTDTYAEEKSEEKPTVVGVTSSGEALAGKVKHQKRDLFNTSSDQSIGPGEVGLSHSARWVNGTIYMDIRSIATEIISNKTQEDGVRSIPAWTYEFNSTMKKGIRDIGTRHLLAGLNRDERLNALGYVANILASSFIEGNILQEPIRLEIPPNFGDIAFAFIFVGLMYKGASKLLHPQTPPEGRRFSLFYGPQIDRAIALQIASRSTTLVQDLKESPKKV